MISAGIKDSNLTLTKTHNSAIILLETGIGKNCKYKRVLNLLRLH